MFTMQWNKETSSWVITSDLVEDASKIVDSLEKANMIIPNWMVQLEGQLIENEEESSRFLKQSKEEVSYKIEIHNLYYLYVNLPVGYLTV